MPESPARQSVSILLVDDDAMVRQSVAAYLEDCGYRVEQAADGLAALQCLRQGAHALVITDIKMPRMDGLSLLREIAADPQPLPVLVMSGAGSVQDVVEALRHGAADYLFKPIADFRVLGHAIERSLERERLLEQNRVYREELEKANREMAEYLRLLEQDQQAGRQLQLKLFPQQDLDAGDYHCSHCIIPSLYLSGDYLEYAAYGDEIITFYLADVSGHGVSSAFVTALLHQFSLNVFRETRQAALDQRPSPFLSPADVLSYYNRELMKAGIDKHVTMFLAVLDRQRNTLWYSVAGHLPMPILASGNDVHYLEGSGMPIGILREAEYRNYSIGLPDQFTLVLCSDGVLEVLPAANLIEKEALLLARIAGSDRTQQGIEEALGVHAMADDAPDDIAIMTLVKAA